MLREPGVPHRRALRAASRNDRVGGGSRSAAPNPWLASTTSFGRDVYFFRVVCPLRWSTFSELGLRVSRNRAAGKFVPVTPLGLRDPVVPTHARLGVLRDDRAVCLGRRLNDQEPSVHVMAAGEPSRASASVNFISLATSLVSVLPVRSTALPLCVRPETLRPSEVGP